MARPGDTSRRNATLIVANTTATSAGVELAAELADESVLSMHEALLGHDEPDIAGRWRDQPVWIGSRPERRWR